MKSFLLLLLTAFLPIATATANDRNDIERLITAYGKAMSASDTAAVMRLYTADAMLMPSGLPSAEGWHAVKNAYDHEFDVIDLEVSAIVDEISIGPKIAFARTRSKGNLILLKTNERKNTDSYRALFVLKKENSQWKIHQFIFNFSK